MTVVRNVVLLSVDALRADHLSCHGYDRETTPNLDALADETFLFERAYSASSHTREAVPALLTGRHPGEAVGGDYRLAGAPVSTRVDTAVDATAAFHSNPYVSRAFGYDRGFDAFDDDLHLGKHKLIALAQRAIDKLRNRHYARASEINDRSLSWVDSLADDDSFFLWNHYMDPHGPYIPPAEYRNRYTDRQASDREQQRLFKRAIRDPESITDGDRQFLVDLYDAEVRYTDAQIGAFLDGLDRRGLLAETAVVVTADHGEAFGEHGYYEHPRYVHDELTHVPLVVRVPGTDANVGTGRVETPASTLDVVPTVLDALGLDDGTGPGRSLLAVARNRPDDRVVFAQATGEDENAHLRRFGAWSRDGRAFVTHDTDAGTSEVTDYTDEAAVAALEEHVAERAQGEGVQPRDEAVADEEIESRLSALGYKE